MTYLWSGNVSAPQGFASLPSSHLLTMLSLRNLGRIRYATKFLSTASVKVMHNSFECRRQTVWSAKCPAMTFKLSFVISPRLNIVMQENNSPTGNKSVSRPLTCNVGLKIELNHTVTLDLYQKFTLVRPSMATTVAGSLPLILTFQVTLHVLHLKHALD